MTRQIEDKICYNRKNYPILTVENRDSFFDPKEHGFNPVSTITACHRGYYCFYKVKDKKLILDKMNIDQLEGRYLWRGIKPSGRGWTYAGIELPIKYSGGIMIGKNKGLYLLEFMDLKFNE